MAGHDVLIVSPPNLKFQAPFQHLQRRQLSLLNLGPQDMVYSIDISHEALFQVRPTRGKVAAFDTTELSILMQPAPEEKSGCSLTVKFKVSHANTDQTEVADAEEDWEQARSTVVGISLEKCFGNERELLSMFGLDDDGKKPMEQQYRPLCNKCSLKRIYGTSKNRSFWPMLSLLTLLSVVAYFGWNWLGPNAEMVF